MRLASRIPIDIGPWGVISGKVRWREVAFAVEGVLVPCGICAAADAPSDDSPALVQQSAFSTPGGPSASPESRLQTGSFQYGAGLTAEALASAGALCSKTPNAPCVVGSGGGLAVRFGYRYHAPFHLGAAYECSKLDAHKAVVLPILQQLRVEARYFVPLLLPHSAFIVAGAGGAGYGAEWSVQTFGGMLLFGGGIEWHLSRTAVLATSVTYRPILLKAWVDPTGQSRPSGVVSFVGLEVSVEQLRPADTRATP
jgi:hypothetical protein